MRGARVLVTGGAGYVGCVLVPELLARGYEVIVYDRLLFGAEGLSVNGRMRVLPGDIRDTARLADALQGVWGVIHLACISNDPSFELDPALSKSINYDCFEALVATCKHAGVRRFVYASTSSVYGVSRADEVTEEHPLVPLTDYNKYKGLCEPILLRHQSPAFTTVIVRPATVCGYSPRMRLDLVVNLLTKQAVTRRRITVLGGAQKRPSIHIDDMAELYGRLLEWPAELVGGEVFNVAYANNTVAELAQIVQSVVEREFPNVTPITIETRPTNDPRSYHVSSRKIAERLSYTPKRSVQDAVRDICVAFRDGRLASDAEDDRYYNVRTIKTSGLR